MTLPKRLYARIATEGREPYVIASESQDEVVFDEKRVTVGIYVLERIVELEQVVRELPKPKRVTTRITRPPGARARRRAKWAISS